MQRAMNLPVPIRILNAVAVAIFASFSWVQYNDIDPSVYYNPSSLDAALWLGFYAMIAVLFGISFWRPSPKWLLLIAAAACLVEMARTGWGLWVNIFGDDEFTMMQYSMSSTDPRVELSREFFGALIALAAVGLLWWERGRFATDSKAPAAQSD